MYKTICQKPAHFLSAQMAAVLNSFLQVFQYLGCITLDLLDFFFKCNHIASNDHQYCVNFTITFRAQNVHSRRLEILLFHKSLSLAPKIYSTLSIYLKKYFYVALVRTSSFHKWLSYWYLHNKSTKGSQKLQILGLNFILANFINLNFEKNKYFRKRAAFSP